MKAVIAAFLAIAIICVDVGVLFAAPKPEKVASYQWHVLTSVQHVPNTPLRIASDTYVHDSDANGIPESFTVKKTASLLDYRGKPLIINFFTRSCAPCREELPLLDAFAERYGNYANIVAIGIEKVPYDALRQFLDEELKLKDIQLAQDQLGELYPQMSYNGLPITYVIDKSGAVRAFFIGALKEEDLKYLKRLLRVI